MLTHWNDWNDWNDFRTLEDPAGWAELEENGWGTLLAWAARPENTGRFPATDEGRTVRVECERGGVIAGPWLEAFTPEDRDGIEQDINFFITDAGVPARPRGFTWFLRVPSGGCH